jgi:hypothetical protein
MAMKAPDQCRVDGCDRAAAASVARDDLPGPLRLCATHLEDFRQNDVGWKIDWSKEVAEPTSVVIPVMATVGLSGPAAVHTTEPQQVPGRSPLKSLLQLPARAVQRMEARAAARRKNHQ